MPTVQYAIAWIATDHLAFQGGLRILHPSQENSVWKVEAPRDHASVVPHEYAYNHKKINGHTVYLANAIHEDNVACLADIMMNRLKRNHLHIRMFLVSGLSYIDDFHYLPVPPTPNDWVFDTFPVGTGRVSVEAERNGQRLLTAAASYQNTQLRDNYVFKTLFLYDSQDPGLALNMGCANGFFGLPSMAFFGLCYRSDVSETAQTNAGAVAGTQIKGVLEHLEKLESVVRH